MRLLGIHIAQGYSSEARVFAEWLAHRGERYDALVLMHAAPADAGDVETFRRVAGARVQALDTGWRANPRGDRSLAAKLGSRARLHVMLGPMLAAVARYRPDVIFSNQQKWDCYAATIVARLLRRPHVILLCYPIVPALGRQVIGRLRSCAHVAAICSYARREAIEHGVSPGRVTTTLPVMAIPRPLPPQTRREARAELGIPADAPVAGVVARLDRQKGQTDAIEAFATIAAAQPAARLLVVGHTATTGGILRADLERLAAARGVADRVHFEGYRPDFRRVLSALDVFLHPARDDTISLAPLEAAANGLPVIAYAESGALETVSQGATGLLVPTGDIPQLGESLGRLLGDVGLARSMGAAGRARILREFRPEDRGRAFADLLQQVAAHRATPSESPAPARPAPDAASTREDTERRRRVA